MASNRSEKKDVKFSSVSLPSGLQFTTSNDFFTTADWINNNINNSRRYYQEDGRQLCTINPEDPENWLFLTLQVLADASIW